MKPADRLNQLVELRRRQAASERGAVTIIVALSMTVIMMATAFSFDIGRLVVNNRSMQSLADSVALDTAAVLDGGYAGSPDAASSNGLTLAQFAQNQAIASASRNGFTAGGSKTLTLCLGTWNGSTSTFLPAGVSQVPATSAQWTAACNAAATDQTQVVTAVRIQAGSPTTYAFAPGSGNSLRQATAVRFFGTPPTNCIPCAPIPTPQTKSVASFTVGSYVADLNTENSILAGLGPSVNVTAVGYQGLAAASVSVQDLITAAAALGTPTNAINASVSPSTLLGWFVQALATDASKAVNSGQPALGAALQTASTILTAIQPYIKNSTKVSLCKMVDVSEPSTCSASDGATEQLSAANFLNALAGVATCPTGNPTDTSCSGVTISTAALGIITLKGNLITPQASAGPGPVGLSATDQQGNIAVGVNVAGVSVSLNVTAGTATGTLSNITCGPTPQSTSTTIGVTSNAATLSVVGSVTTLNVLGINVVVPVSLPVTLGSTNNPPTTTDPATFNGPFSPPPSTSNTKTESPNLTLSLGASVLGTTVGIVLNPVLQLLAPLLNTLGLSVGGAVVSTTGVTCGLPVLVG